MQPTVDITPSPRVLRMLGQIDFQPWQCLAELIDNSIDSFLDMREKGTAVASPRVTIELPSDTELQKETGKLVIKDNGSGMNSDQLQHAVRAGYSGNDPVEKMGLFGMGFNISTARLGRRTEVWTTTSESSQWIGVVIDFDRLEKSQTFITPVKNREKNEFELQTQVHGTEVQVMKLEPDRIRPLIKGVGKTNTRNKLGKIYGRVMASLGVTIIYGGDNLKPWQHCTWDARRTVPTKNFGNVPARLDIEKELDPRRYCTTCWIWLGKDEKECPSCGSTDHLIERRRRLKGWIGVQRYFDKQKYGIDLIRNGRIIEELDKSLFYFEDNQGDKVLEYPIDATHWGGRIVGELEIDFVRVSHQKDSFDKLDPEWKHVVEIVRGNSPLRPQIAAQMALEINTSPLAKLYAGFRSGHVGLKELVPGNAKGDGMNEGLVREYVDRFYGGEEEYQTDDKMYELVRQGEEGKRGKSTGDKKAGGDFPIDVEDQVDETPGITGVDIPPATDEDGEEFENDPELSRTYKLKIEQLPIEIKVRARKVKNPTFAAPFLVRASGFNFEFDYNPRDPFFEESLETPLDCLMVDLSHHFLVCSAQSTRDWPVSRIARLLRSEYFPETLTSIARMAEIASAFLADFRAFLDERLSGLAPIDPAKIDKETLKKIQLRALQTDLKSQEFVNETIKTGKFVKYVDNKFLVQIIGQWPNLVMDSAYFTNPYESIPPELKPEALRMLINGMEDVWWLAEEARDAISKDTAWRLRYGRSLASLQLVESWRS